MNGCVSYSAITVWQPWASLIPVGAKPFEFRGWAAPRRLWGQRIAIHAGARPVRRKEIADLIEKLYSERWRETGLDRAKALDLLEAVWRSITNQGSLIDQAVLPLSSIVGFATLGTPIRDLELAQALGLDTVNDSTRDEHSNYGWPMLDPKPLEPVVPARGRQGWWNWNGSDA